MDKKYFLAIIPTDEITIQESAKKSGNGTIECTGECQAIYCRIHSGDENGYTTYKWGDLVVVDAENRKIVSAYEQNKSVKDFVVSLTDPKSDALGKESKSNWVAAANYVMTGRKHTGDENGDSVIYSKKVVVKIGNETADFNLEASEEVISPKESSGTVVQYAIENCVDINGEPTTLYLPITGRSHNGDENAKTVTTFSKLVSGIPEYLPRYCMVARKHSGDENGKTQVKFAALTLPQRAREIGIDDVWLTRANSFSQKESESDFLLDSSPARVITRRTHQGDENAETKYCTAQVWVKINGRAMALGYATEITEVLTSKESSGEWVEKPGFVIIGRRHIGDENGSTITRFAKICLLVPKTNELIPLELTDVQTKEQKESDSDFYIETYRFANQFKVHYSPVDLNIIQLKGLDHVWVESVDPARSFCCNGGTNGDDVILVCDVDENAYAIMDKCRGYNDFTNMTYGIDGVCHQAANRFIYPVSGDLIKKGEHPKGYTISCFFYGKLGRNYSEWYNEYVLPAMNSVLNNKGIYFKDEITYLQQSVQEIADEYGIDLEPESIKQIQQYWLDKSKQIASKYGVLNGQKLKSYSEDTIRKFVSELIELQRKTLQDLKAVIGESKFRLLNNGESEMLDIIDKKTAINYYCK